MTLSNSGASGEPFVPPRMAASASASALEPSFEIPPPPPSDTSNRWGVLPPGWTTAISPQDGRIYYWERSTGKTSWSHPLATPQLNGEAISQTPPSNNAGAWMRPWRGGAANTHRSISMEYQETPWSARHRPNNEQCYAMLSLLLCFPIGVLAVYQSYCVDVAWREGRYGDAVNHSRQTSQYACFGTTVGVMFWVWYFFSDSIRQIPDWFKQ